jgi:hypothetical protein
MVAPPVEELIARAVLYRLDTPELAGRNAQDEALSDVADELAADRAQLEELAAAYAQRAFTMREWLAARAPIEQRIASNEKRFARASNSDALHGLIGNGEELGRTWDSLNLDRQAAIINAVLDHAVIGPGGARCPQPGPGPSPTGLEAVGRRPGAPAGRRGARTRLPPLVPARIRPPRRIRPSAQQQPDPTHHQRIGDLDRHLLRRTRHLRPPLHLL